MPPAKLPFETRILRRLPVSTHRVALRLLYLPKDLLDTLLRRRPPLVPPRGRAAVGAGDFLKVGRDFLDLFVTPGGLRPTDRVLDIGCGIGRMAVPLTGFLTTGSYLGFDVVRQDIGWCRKTITPRHPRFQFSHADVRNDRYNPRGRVPAEAFRFPAADASLDFAIATSLFTHLLPEATGHYLKELGRVLAPGGRGVLTFFLLDEEARALLAAGHSGLDFRHPAGESFVHNPRVPEEAVAYPPHVVERFLTAAGLQTVSLLPGFWPGRSGPSYQDILVVERI